MTPYRDLLAHASVGAESVQAHGVSYHGLLRIAFRGRLRVKVSRLLVCSKWSPVRRDKLDVKQQAHMKNKKKDRLKNENVDSDEEEVILKVRKLGKPVERFLVDRHKPPTFMLLPHVYHSRHEGREGPLSVVLPGIILKVSRRLLFPPWLAHRAAFLFVEIAPTGFLGLAWCLLNGVHQTKLLTRAS
ncbi:hypothetical protein Cgig2_005221 [Carnegiea gigantea]|uniref:Uncharacterized protein n=1 Tax=Carnegiea gigantea TaxID=171969 RepID=A0A9Q1QBR3_9CARY|nr:hypothetical protein Cgig2_005221 [Carnegiea gigantea]